MTGGMKAWVRERCKNGEEGERNNWERENAASDGRCPKPWSLTCSVRTKTIDSDGTIIVLGEFFILYVHLCENRKINT